MDNPKQNTQDEASEIERRKRGPVPGPPTRQYTVMLEPEPAEWAKTQPGGLSEFLRRFIREAYEAREK